MKVLDGQLIRSEHHILAMSESLNKGCERGSLVIEGKFESESLRLSLNGRFNKGVKIIICQ